MNKYSKRSLTLGAVLATTALTTPAYAQIGPGMTAPPVFQAVDANGVELQTGKVVKVLASISIGPEGPGGLRFDWSTDSSRQGAAWGYVLNKQNPQDTTKDIASVSIGGSTETFSAPHGTFNFTQDQGRPSTLTYNSATSTYTYTRSDGAVATFNGSTVVGTDPAYGQTVATGITSLVYPTGERLDYYYATSSGYRNVRAVTSSLGYQLRLTWSGLNVTSAVLFNMNSETCDPAAASCSLTGDWPRLTWNDTSKRVVDSTGKWVGYTSSGGTSVISYPSGVTLTYTIGSYNDGKGTWTYQFPNQQYGGGVSLVFNPENNAPRVVQWSTTNGLFTSDTIHDGITGTSLITSYAYDSKNRLTSVTRPDGTKTTYGYDSRGNMNEVRQVSSTAGTPADIVTTMTFPSTCSNVKTCNQPTSVTDPRGNTTDYTYHASSGQVATVTLPAPTTGAVRPQTRYSYTQQSAQYRNGSGTIVSGSPVWKLDTVSQCQTQSSCAGTADEVETSFTYDPDQGLLPSAITMGAGNGSLAATSSYAYTGTGAVKTVDGPLAGTADTTRNYYDAMGRAIGVIGPDPDGAGALKRRAVRATYDADGRPSVREEGTATGQGDNDLTSMTALEQQVTTYDAQGRIATVADKTGTTIHALVQLSYTNAGLPDCQALRMNPAIFASPPADACTLGTQGSNGPDRITKYGHDGYFRPTTVTNGYGTADAAVELTNGYDSVGRLASVRDAEDNLTTYEYDGMGRLWKTRYPVAAQSANQSSTADYEQRGYDPAGNVTSLRLRDGTSIAFSYDKLNQMTLKDLPGTEPDVTYDYDNLGRLMSASRTGNALSFTYDALDRLLTEVGPLGTVASEWDLAGRRIRLTYPGTGLFVNYDYLLTGEMSKIRENGATSGIGVLATFGYDDLGRRTSLTYGNGAAISYGYSQASQLESLALNLAGTANDLNQTFTYNPVGQIKTRARPSAYAWTEYYAVNRNYSANGLNQYTATGAITPTYDARGNLTSAGSATYAFSSENMLTSASGGITLAYDPLLRLYQTVGSTTTRMAYDGQDLIAEYNGSNGLLRRYVHGPSDDEPIVWYEGTGTASRRWLHADERGSIVAISDATASTMAINTYDEFGIPGTANLGRFQYTGQQWLPELGMYHYKARIYSPTLGRFLQTDPIGYDDGMNMYAYVGNDPINGWDPTGLECAGISNATCSDDDPIVITARMSAEEARRRAEEEARRAQAARDATISSVLWYLDQGASLLVPGYDLGRCMVNGCTKAELALAVATLHPGAKLVSIGGKLVIRQVAKRMAKGGCKGCFVAGTLVATPEGLVAIESIEIGDEVLAFDEATGKIAPKPVTDLIRPEPRPIYELRLRDPQGNEEVFHATDDHPWKVEQKGWIETVNLAVGDLIDTASGADMTVLSLAVTERVEQPYNLTVADWHTFFVGDDQVLVHNTCPFSPAKRALVEMAKADKKKGGVTQADMDAYKALNKQLPDPFPSNKVRGLEQHPGRGAGSQPHGHVGPVNHIPGK